MAPHFLCCLPIRLGAFVVGVVEFLLSGAVAGLMWAVLWFNNSKNDAPTDKLSEGQEVVVGIWAASYTVLFLFSIFGILGVLRKHISWIQSFLSLMRAHLIGSGIITIINIVFFVIHLKDNECIAVDENGNCESTSLSRGAQIAIVIVFALIPLLIEAYGCWILSDCVKYLKDKQVYPMTLYPFSNRGYATVGPSSREEMDSLTHNSGSAAGRPYASGGV
ncbi:hypothetical protein BT96DRAFT_328716 [Gymnopus androsaceus JB14]|uniref:MARVEL domain-containing protein n=1 Tax=Gymnopus androsaceus JB14 TaxID=1447944 RepID=A0A6A4IA32_9AGAR|nr:hypothetical protein BT96DRAFT_328716 [Gymnopus androsaceus JB14]